MSRLGENIKRMRQQQRLSQVQLAAKAGVSQQLISQLERGVNTSTTELPAIASALECAVFDLDESYLPDVGGVPLAVVPLVAWVSAGAMLSPDVTDEMLGQVRVADLPSGDWIALRVEGDSMDQISPPKSIILVDRKRRALVPNACYVIEDGDGNATYKRYRPNPDRFEPVSSNKELSAIFPDNTPRVVGRVMRTFLDLF